VARAEQNLWRPSVCDALAPSPALAPPRRWLQHRLQRAAVNPGPRCWRRHSRSCGRTRGGRWLDRRTTDLKLPDATRSPEACYVGRSELLYLFFISSCMISTVPTLLRVAYLRESAKMRIYSFLFLSTRFGRTALICWAIVLLVSFPTLVQPPHHGLVAIGSTGTDHTGPDSEVVYLFNLARQQLAPPIAGPGILTSLFPAVLYRFDRVDTRTTVAEAR
jgi:hypothetical protein